MIKCLVNVFLFCVSSASHNHRLLQILWFNKFSYFFTSCVPVHYWHRTIHKYQTVWMFTFFISRNDKIKSILSRMNTIYYLLNIWITGLFQYDLKTNNVIWFIINNHDPSIFFHLNHHFFVCLIFYYASNVI